MPLNRICIIGCGNMGGACLSGWLKSEDGVAAGLATESFVVVSPFEEDRKRVESEFGVKCVSSPKELASDAPIDLILLAVKPQVLPGVLEELAESGILDSSKEHNPIVLSIAAGISTDSIEKALPEGVHVVRAMPNMPLQVCHGATAICRGTDATPAEVDTVNQLFCALGTSSEVDESLIDAVCAISGGGPAYVAYMIESLRDAGVALGLDKALAESLALETVGGTYESMCAKDVSPEEMRKSVCSPGGTTLAALAELDAAGFKQMFANAMDAAVKRAAELREGA